MEVFFYKSQNGLLSVSKNDTPLDNYPIRVQAREISEEDWNSIIAFTSSNTGPRNKDVCYRDISTFLRQFVQEGVVATLDRQDQEEISLVA